MEHPFSAQIILKCLARVLASKITTQNNPLCIPDIQVGILYRLYCKISCHGRAISISDNLAAAQIHYGSQICPSFFRHMDIIDIRTPFLIDGFRFKVSFQDIYFIIWDSSMVGMVIIPFYYYRP